MRDRQTIATFEQFRNTQVVKRKKVELPQNRFLAKALELQARACFLGMKT